MSTVARVSNPLSNRCSVAKCSDDGCLHKDPRTTMCKFNRSEQHIRAPGNRDGRRKTRNPESYRSLAESAACSSPSRTGSEGHCWQVLRKLRKIRKIRNAQDPWPRSRCRSSERRLLEGRTTRGQLMGVLEYIILYHIIVYCTISYYIVV